MLFEFDADQRLLADTVREVVARQCTSALIRDIVDKGADPGPLWQTYVGLGWTELTEPDSAVELGIVCEELGRATDPTPFLATVSQFAPLAPEVACNQAGAAVYSGVTAAHDGTDWRLRGTARYVLDGDRAERFAVVTDAGVFVVDAGSVRARRTPVFDPVLHVAEVTFDDVAAAESARRVVDVAAARERALTAMALHTVGACRRILDLSLEHVRNRKQFGVAIGSFQAVQHKAADMYIAIERARALGYFAALCLAADDPRRALAASMAKAAAGECQSSVFRNGVQLFGGMGFTWENDLQFALKRAKAADLLFGGADHHRALITEGYRATQL